MRARLFQVSVTTHAHGYSDTWPTKIYTHGDSRYISLSRKHKSMRAHTHTHACSIARVEDGDNGRPSRSDLPYGESPRVPAENIGTPAGSRHKQLAKGWRQHHGFYIRELANFRSRGKADASLLTA